MDLENIMLSEIGREKKTIWYYLYGESEKYYKWIHMENRNRFINIENKLVVLTKGRGKEWEQIRGLGLTDTKYYT